MWSRERRVWGRGGQVPRTCPPLVHTVRRTALGPQDASISSPLGVAVVVARSLGVPLDERGVWPARGDDPRASQGRCSFGMRRGTPARGYVRAEAWRDATLERGPNHPHGGCSLARHGTYARKTPRGTWGLIRGLRPRSVSVSRGQAPRSDGNHALEAPR